MLRSKEFPVHKTTVYLSLTFSNSQVRRIDGQLDNFLWTSRLPKSSHTDVTALPDESAEPVSAQNAHFTESPRIHRLQGAVKSLSTTSSSRNLLPPTAIVSLLEKSDLSSSPSGSEIGQPSKAYEQELVWLLLGKATAQTYGLILNALLEQAIPLSNDIWYWDDLLSSFSYTAIYSVQTSPLRLWNWTTDIYCEARRRLETTTGNTTSLSSTSGSNEDRNLSLGEQWQAFYRLVRASIRDRSITNIQTRMLAPFALSRVEARRKQQGLQTLREMSASGLGVLMDEALSFDSDDAIPSKSGDKDVSRAVGKSEEWKRVVEKSAALMETVLRNVTALENGVADFEDVIFASVEDDVEDVTQSSSEGESGHLPRTAILSRRLQKMLKVHIPEQARTSDQLAKEYGRPSRLIRYWLPATVLLVSSSTLLRLVINRKAAITEWIREFGTTVVDFWANWVIEPTRKVISTIRHDAEGEVAIMSKHSLEGDRASLERMVIDFAIDNPSTSAAGSRLSEPEVAEIRMKVKEGDLTPVLRAYEKDLRRPLMGTVRGDLIRALLIQVQKTKVDVEVAVSGIDALLKSQQLVFGLVGLFPPE